MKSDAPRFASFPVSPENVPTKHRAIFSSSFAGLSSHHVQPASMPAMPQRHRHVDDDSLRLIDDLTNRPMDVLYSDSRLATKKRSAVSIWATRILVFLICIAVGAAGSVFVRQLSTDPRKEVRKQLASQLTEQTKRVGDLTKDVNDLRSQIESESESLASWSLNQTMQDDEMVNGTLPVQGEGIVLTVANPLSVSGDNADSSLPRENGRFESSPIPICSCLSPCYGNPERRRSRSTATALACKPRFEPPDRRFSSESIRCKAHIESRR